MDNHIIQQLIIPVLFEDKEYSGNLEFSLEKKSKMTISDPERTNLDNKHHLSSIVKGRVTKLKSGGTSSVSVSKGFINFHTHPKDCYLGEKTNWGWPSGDDMRECIRFTFSGTICHVVFALEGAYTIQVNPCMIEILNNFDDKDPKGKEKKISRIKDFINRIIKEESSFKKQVDEDYVRGMIISLLENYFKATHGHRCWEENLKLEQMGKGICTPYDWVTFANNFKFNCMVSKTNTCTENLPCARVPTERGKAIDLGEYMSNYEYEHWDYDIKGESTDNDPRNDFHKFLATRNDIIMEIYNVFNPKCTYSYGNETWEGGQWFNVKFFPNKFRVNNQVLSLEQLINNFKQISGASSSLSESLHKYFKQITPDQIILDTPLTIQSKPRVDKNGEFGFRFGKRINVWLKET